MTKFYLKTLLFCLLYIVGIAKAFAYTAYDIAAKNADGVTIYYNYIKNKTELEVTLSSNNIGNSYSGNVVIPETVTLYGNTYRVTSIGDNAIVQVLPLLLFPTLLHLLQVMLLKNL